MFWSEELRERDVCFFLLCCALGHSTLVGENALSLCGGAVRVAPSVAWTHAQSRPCTDNAACGIVVVARRRRLLLRDMGTHQYVSEAGEGMKALRVWWAAVQ